MVLSAQGEEGGGAVQEGRAAAVRFEVATNVQTSVCVCVRACVRARARVAIIRCRPFRVVLIQCQWSSSYYCIPLAA